MTAPEHSDRPAGETVVSRSPNETLDLEERLVRSVRLRGVIALHGELGSGKTCFVRGIARCLGIRRIITSPTFTIINEYGGEHPLYHIDLYRIAGPDEALAFGIEDYFEAGGIAAIEWAERAGDVLPLDAVHVRLEALPEPESRKITICGP